MLHQHRFCAYNGKKKVLKNCHFCTFGARLSVFALLVNMCWKIWREKSCAVGRGWFKRVSVGLQLTQLFCFFLFFHFAAHRNMYISLQTQQMSMFDCHTCAGSSDLITANIVECTFLGPAFY